MTVAVLGAVISAAGSFWNADPITDAVLYAVAALMLAFVIAPYAVAYFTARRDEGQLWTQVVLLVAVLIAIALSVYGNWAFATASGKAKDPLMLAAVIMYQAMVIGPAAVLCELFRR
ncbi:MAG: hypothetical protein KDJ18_13400 [Hyphomicrobiaceae bacterium]|nr:hypothetical protein [Hyphomicrobiaceae bacterium]